MLIVRARIFDGVGDRPGEDGAVRVVGERIDRVGRTADFGDAPADEVIDAGGAFLMPGLVNMHEHLIFRGQVGPPGTALGRDVVDLTLHAVRVAATAIAQGITTVRDMGSRHGIALRVREAVASGVLLGPRVFSCGRALRISGGHGFQALEVDGPDAFRAAAAEQLALGADLIKVMASHDPWPAEGHEKTRADASVDEMRAAFDVAHSAGRPAAAHVMGAEAIGRTLDAGVQVIEHGHYLTDELAERAARQGVFMTPTLSAYNVQTMHPRFARGEAWAGAHDELRPGHAQALAAAVRAGVRLLVGTDSVGCYAEEVELLRAGGLSAAESLRACTSNAAAALGEAGGLGVIRPGATADLVLVDGDPLEDPYALERPRLVVTRGRAFDPRQLAQAERILGATPVLGDLVRRA